MIAVAHDQNEVGIPDGGEPMGNDEAGAVFHQFNHRFLDQQFCSGVNRTCRFIEDQDRGRPGWLGNGQQLFLSLRDVTGFLEHHVMPCGRVW